MGVLKGVLDKLVSTNQSSFIPNRGLFDIVLVLNELIDFAQRNIKGLFLFKLDLKKAFNSVSSDYLFYVLKRMNFRSKWLKWIKACICSSFFINLINGSRTIDFQARKGLRQGGPLSLFLFLLAARGIACLMWNALFSHFFHPFAFTDNLSSNLLQFVDNTMIVAQPSWENIWSIKALLHGFEICSSLSVNFHKSRIISFNIKLDFLKVVFDLLSCVISPFSF